MNSLQDFIESIKGKPWTYRLKVEGELSSKTWSRWLICPIDDYIECENEGPYEVRTIEWIEINPIECRYIGRLLPEKTIDHTAEVIDVINQHDLSSTQVDGRIRVLIEKGY